MPASSPLIVRQRFIYESLDVNIHHNASIQQAVQTFYRCKARLDNWATNDSKGPLEGLSARYRELWDAKVTITSMWIPHVPHMVIEVEPLT